MLLPFLGRVDLGDKRAFFEIFINFLLFLLYHFLDLMLLPDVHSLEEGGIAASEVALVMFYERLESALDVDLVLAALVLLQ